MQLVDPPQEGAPLPVSVLMTTHNGGVRLAASLDSMLAQSFRNFELIVVNDASTDATPALLAAYAAHDRRIRVITATRNLGVVGARNLGFAACRGIYVAMLDHDDLSCPERLAAQVSYLEASPGTVLVGTGVLIEEGSRLRLDAPAPSNPLALRWALHIGNPFTWSSVMLRAAAVQRLGTFLQPDYEYADDFELYHRLLPLGEVARLEAPLTVYRWHDSNTTQRHAGLLASRAAQVLSRAYQRWFGEAAGDAATLALRHLSDRQPARDVATLDRLGIVLERVLEGFGACLRPVDREIVAALAAAAWWDAVRSATRAGMPAALGLLGSRPRLCQALPPRTERLAALGVGMLRAGRKGWPFARPSWAGAGQGSD